jgi:hypothetical protein
MVILCEPNRGKIDIFLSEESQQGYEVAGG